MTMPDQKPTPGPCPYCRGECEPGWIETDNNGPIVCCPVCNRDGDKDRIWERAEAQRSAQRRLALSQAEGSTP